MKAFFAYPPAAAFGRVIPKSKIYEHAGSTAALKELFTTQVGKIIWKYKLAPETINLAATPSVTEIQVFAINLRKAELNFDVLRAIDKAVPFPLIFELYYAGKCKIVAAFKRPHEADATKWVVSKYFESGWFEENTPRQSFPLALDMRGLYQKLLEPLLRRQEAWRSEAPTGNEKNTAWSAERATENEKKSDYGSDRNNPTENLRDASTPSVDDVASEETLEQQVARVEAIQLKKREIERIKSRLKREKQYNKQTEINAELRTAREQLARLEKTGRL